MQRNTEVKVNRNADQMVMSFVDDNRYIIVLPAEGDAYAEPFNEDTIASKTEEVVGGIAELATTVEVPPYVTVARDGYGIETYVNACNTDEFIRNHMAGKRCDYTPQFSVGNLCENRRLMRLGVDGRSFYGNAVLCGYDGDKDVGIKRQHVDFLLWQFNNSNPTRKEIKKNG